MNDNDIFVVLQWI